MRRRRAPRELAVLLLVDTAVDTGLDVVEPKLRPEPGNPANNGVCRTPSRRNKASSRRLLLSAARRNREQVA